VRYYDQVQLVAYGTVTSTPRRVLPPDVQGETDYKGDLDKRGATLRDVAKYIRTHSQSQLGGPKVLKVLVVPEFYFRFGGPMAAGEPQEKEKNSYPHEAVTMITKMVDDVLVPEFQKPEWNDWIIVAGSVFWHGLYRESQDTEPQPTFLNTSIVINGGELTDDQYGTDTVPTLNRLSTNQKALMSNIDWTLDEGYDPRAWDAALNPMFKATLRGADYLRWHRFKARGKGNGRNGAPIVFGVEVCLEHEAAGWGRQPALGVLRYLTDGNPPAPDVQIVTSCGMALNPAIGVATQPQGIAMICDGSQFRTGFRPNVHKWPRAGVSVTDDVTPEGVRLMSPMNAPQSFVLPDDLQVGYPYGTANPEDAVSIWTPVDLPTYPAYVP
jgi:hypothetical protein